MLRAYPANPMKKSEHWWKKCMLIVKVKEIFNCEHTTEKYDLIRNIPQELKLLSQWIVATIKKVPINPKTDQAASVANPATWGTFEDVVQARQTYNHPHIGLVLTDDDPYTFIDLDAGLDATHMQEMIDRFDSYAERSQSGKGHHIIVKGKIPRNVKAGHEEIYSSKRYMICTGNIVNDKSIEDRQDLLDEYFNYLTSQQPYSHTELLFDYSDEEQKHTDVEIIQQILDSLSTDKFSKLCDGNWQGEYPSQSEADFALLSLLCFYSENDEQVKRIFRSTQLGQREKATRDDAYLNRSIQKIRARNNMNNINFTTKPMDTAKQLADNVILTRASDIPIVPIRWLWPGWLARGKMHILAGALGQGKTTIAMAMAAAVSSGGVWPDGRAAGAPGNVLVWTGEDDPGDTLNPRLAGMGADLTRIRYVPRHPRR
jgi:hypothetical protein